MPLTPSLFKQFRRSTTTPSVPGSLLTPNRLNFIGGYRIPEAAISGLTTAFSECGIGGRTEGDGTVRFWIPGHANQLSVWEMTAPTTRGTFPVANYRTEWPVATAVRNIQQYSSGLYGSLRASDNAFRIFGCHWDTNTDRLLFSGRSWYSTFSAGNTWLAAIDVSGPDLVEDEQIDTGLHHQQFGGDFCYIPQDFADAYCGGNNLGLGLGGYESGQASGHGPTLCAFGANPNKIMAYFPWQGDKENHEQRDNNYGPGLVSWQPAADGDVGYWGTARCMGITWVKTATCSSFIAISLQPVGSLSYALQGDVFTGNSVQYVLYVYDPADLALVAQGLMPSHQLRGQRYPFPYAGRPRGMWWDPVREVLSICYRNVWSFGGSESYPAIYEFTIT